jgi:archaellum biogenesis ATPase FlaH
MLDYDREFRLKILALCLDNSWMAKYGTSIISQSYFDRDDEHAFISSVLKYREKYKKSPSDPYDVIALCGGKFSTFILDMYELYDEGDFSLASDLVIQFAREQAAKIAILDSVDDVNAGRIQPAIDRMKEALKIGQNLLDSGLDPIRNIRDWLYDYWEEKTRTGFMHIDNVLQGGVLPGELSIILAPPNRGKSMALINVGYSVASIGSGKNVLHFTHEMSKQQTAKRYAARMVFRFPKHVDNLETYAEDVVETANWNYKNY